MDKTYFIKFLSNLSNEVKKKFTDIFDEPVKKFYSDMKKNIKILSQDMQKLEPNREKLVKL